MIYIQKNQSKTYFVLLLLQVVLKGDPKKLNLHGVRKGFLYTLSKHATWICYIVKQKLKMMHNNLIKSPSLLSLCPVCHSHSRRAPCVWRTSKWKTNWECCHANMLSTGSEYTRAQWSLSLLLLPLCTDPGLLKWKWSCSILGQLQWSEVTSTSSWRVSDGSVVLQDFYCSAMLS